MLKKIFTPGNDSKLTSLGLLVLRLWLGLTMLLHHGMDKVYNFNTYTTKFPDPLHIGVKPGLILVIFAETACAAMLALGLLTRFAALVLAIDMGVAFFLVHKSLDGGELAFIYFGTFLTLLIAGPGKFSVDKIVFGKGSSNFGK
jgi:putative oxidoreductase